MARVYGPCAAVNDGTTIDCVAMNELERLFGQQQSVRLLQSIETAAWSIAVLLVIVAALLLFGLSRSRAKQAERN